jgi:hypothetical protein
MMRAFFQRPTWRRRLPAAAAALLTAAAGAATPPALDDVIALLEREGVAVDPTNAAWSAIGGLIRAIDPQARVLTPAEAADLRKELAGATSGAGALATAELWPEDIAYFRVRALVPGSGEELLGHLLAVDGGAGVIVDLRGADGTSLDAAAELAGAFRGAADLLFEVRDGRNGVLERRRARDMDRRPGCRMIMILVDGDTTAAAELLAATLKGCPGVMLIGSKTRGDAALRKLIALADGSALYLAAGRTVPAGGAYDRCGVEPDVRVAGEDSSVNIGREAMLNGKPLSAKSVRDRGLMRLVEGDPVLRRATDVLLGLKALGVYERP